MKIIAFDATLPSLSVKDGERVVSQVFSSSDDMKRAVLGVFDNSFDEIRIFRGPGSFTGLRVAHALALGLSVSSRVPIRQMDLSTTEEPLIIPFKKGESFSLCKGEIRIVSGPLNGFDGNLSELLIHSDSGVLTDNPEPFYGVETNFRERF